MAGEHVQNNSTALPTLVGSVIPVVRCERDTGRKDRGVEIATDVAEAALAWSLYKHERLTPGTTLNNCEHDRYNSN